MELTLNLIWLVISASALGCWLLRLRAAQKNALGILTGFVVLGCAAVLLFPSISITDDLYAASDAVEDVTFAVRKAQPIQVVHFVCDTGIAAHASAFTAPSFKVLEWLTDHDDLSPHPGAYAPSNWRAPPTA